MVVGIHIRRFALIKPEKGFLCKKSNSDNTYLIQNNKRTGHEQLVHHIRRGGENSGSNKGDKKGVFTVFCQKRCIDYANFGKKNHQHRQFKDNAKGKEQPQGQGKILTNSRHGIKELTGVPDQKTKSGREDDKITKGRSADKTKGGNESKGQQDFFLMPVQAWSDKTPYLEKNYRAGSKNTADERELQIKKNPS